MTMFPDEIERERFLRNPLQRSGPDLELNIVVSRNLHHYQYQIWRNRLVDLRSAIIEVSITSTQLEEVMA